MRSAKAGAESAHGRTPDSQTTQRAVLVIIIGIIPAPLDSSATATILMPKVVQTSPIEWKT